jgi:hypothetical protein
MKTKRETEDESQKEEERNLFSALSSYTTSYQNLSPSPFYLFFLPQLAKHTHLYKALGDEECCTGVCTCVLKWRHFGIRQTPKRRRTNGREEEEEHKHKERTLKKGRVGLGSLLLLLLLLSIYKQKINELLLLLPSGTMDSCQQEFGMKEEEEEEERKH